MAADVPNNDKDASDSGKKPVPEQGQIALAVNALKKEYETAQADRKEHEHKVFRWTRNAGIGVGIYTLLTAFIMAASIYAAIQSKSSVDAANRAVQAALAANEIAIRPYMKITLEPDSFNLQRGGGGLFVNFKIENFGKLPGFAYIQSGADWEGRGHPRPPDWPSIRMVGEAFIFPDQNGMEFRSQEAVMTGGQFSDTFEGIISGGKFYVMVDASYGFDESRKTQWSTKVCTTYELSRNQDGSIKLINPRPLHEQSCNTAR